jgi:hypothetical protein
MKLALLGCDDEAIALLRAALDSGRHELAWTGELAGDGVTARDTAIARLPEIVAVERDDVEVLAGGAADLVIVSATGDVARRGDQLRELVQAGIAVCVSQCGALGPIVSYELDMNRVETEAPLVPFLPERLHPAVARLASFFAADGELGAIHQMSFERGVTDTRAANVTQQLARDVDVVRAVAGDVTRISGVGVSQGVASPDRDFAALNVYLTTQSGVTARWSIDRALAAGQGRITIDGAKARAILMMRGEAWTLTSTPTDLMMPTDAANVETANIDAASRDESFAVWRPAEVMLSVVERAVVDNACVPSWLDASRAADVADMVEVSLRRSRTIDIYNETYNEQGTFKGMMGIAGCALLLVALFTLFAAAVGQKTAKFFEAEWLATLFGYWHYGLLAVLVMFLLLQLLRFVVPAESGKKT